MNLLIVESPSKAKTISKYLGDDFTVRASVGHIRDLPKSNKKAVDIENGFKPHYELVPKKTDVMGEITDLAQKAKKIILATDPDREGEAIAWHLSEVLKDNIGKEVKNKITRIAFHEITKEAVNEAMKHSRDIDNNLKEAQEARRVLDRLFGYDLSQLIWKKVRYGLSAGRVQSPALRIIMEREREIRSFKSEKFWVIKGMWKTERDEKIELTCSTEPTNKDTVDKILISAKKDEWMIKDINESEQKRSPRAPFITSTLQQVASTRLGFSPSRTMGIAQKLYEAGLITYMRTDSTNLSNQALGQIAGTIKEQFGEKYLSIRKYTTKSKNAQEAHEAIRPTKISIMKGGHTDEQKKLYNLIWVRTVSSQMKEAILSKTKIIANTKNDTVPDFTANGSRILFDGWLKADPQSAGDDITLPNCSKDEEIELQSIESIEKETEPPSRYTEAGLIKELEKRGIGRPSTYASIVKTIQDRGYVTIENRSLRPTDTGDVVSTFVESNFPSYVSDTFTADMENKLDDIANGERKYETTLKEFYTPFHKEIKIKDKLDKVTNLGEADPKYKCPKCGRKMEIKLGRGGKFLSCSKYPDCDGALTIDGIEIKKDEPIGKDPVSDLPIYVLNGRFGPYVQLGENIKKSKTKKSSKKTVDTDSLRAKTDSEESKVTPQKPKMASIPKSMDPSKVTVKDALKYLSLPKELGLNPKTNQMVTASIGRFGPYVVSQGDFRSVKPPLDIYEINLEQALELLNKPKPTRKGKRNSS